MEFVIIKNSRTGHEQKIQKSDWEGYSHLYTGYRLAKDEELESFVKVDEAGSEPESMGHDESSFQPGEGESEEEPKQKKKGKKSVDPEA